MDSGPLVREDIEVGAELVREFDKLEPVTTAFWMKLPDEPKRDLYIAIERLHEIGLFEAYKQVLQLAKNLESGYLDTFRVKLIAADHQLARTAVDIRNRFPSPQATRYGPSMFGDVFADDVYIYPIPLPAANA